MTQMLLPDDYLKTVQKALAAPTMEIKQKYVQDIMKPARR